MGDAGCTRHMAYSRRPQSTHSPPSHPRPSPLQALSGVCSQVQVDVAKSVLKQGAVQHLYGKLSGQLEPGMTDADVLQALHPTPAVCGR